MASKYDPLGRRLTRLGRDQISLGFPEIETLLGFELPVSARKHRAWWSTDSATHVNAHVWMAAGYETAQVDMSSETVEFRRRR